MVDGVFHLVSAADITLEIPDMPEGTEFENLGTTVEVIAANGGKLVVGETEFTLQQFHFHLPSEHLDNGTSIAMEMHMVWESAAQEIAVIGVFVDLDNGAAVAAAAGAAVQAAPEKKRRDVFHPHARRQEEAAPAESVPGSFGGVAGMLTIPSVEAVGVSSSLLETVFTQVEEIATPGTAVKTAPLVMSDENVMWMVATQKLQIQTATFERVRNVIGFNARFPQNTPGEPNLLQVGAAAAAAVQAPIAAEPAAE
ncbi:putative carbonic anhydrase protein [Phaeoacremonium minimum UCRPA7]|uniref:carbonic anhydrase n=1 Tax=Phaeoacremonium minimum (strain UCR-PA7) TaxID=1286976 RepID=R8BP96_PHAM7|nr:putative carbonic anhydrase protein [Phaeoacremonium minimum UCRPA7]EOO01161.1 putative carbonic anhydrase protein [Phaeoacremonium minimum UCRPA7]